MCTNQVSPVVDGKYGWCKKTYFLFLLMLWHYSDTVKIKDDIKDLNFNILFLLNFEHIVSLHKILWHFCLLYLILRRTQIVSASTAQKLYVYRYQAIHYNNKRSPYNNTTSLIIYLSWKCLETFYEIENRTKMFLQTFKQWVWNIEVQQNYFQLSFFSQCAGEHPYIGKGIEINCIWLLLIRGVEQLAMYKNWIFKTTFLLLNIPDHCFHSCSKSRDEPKLCLQCSSSLYTLQF